MIRKPAVSGRFYPSNPTELERAIEGFLAPPVPRSKAIGAIVPHAGYMYSGHVAGAVYARIELPSRNIVLCPNHTGLGVPMSIMRSGAWQTPFGEMQIDEELCAALMDADPELRDDIQAHRFEHALEVQLPFMQQIGGTSVRFVPITIGTGALESLLLLGRAIAGVIQRIAPEALIIASSDMNHYETDSITRVKDRKAIDQILARAPEGLYEVIHREEITMCGYGPAVSMLTAANLLGASKAELVKYATSGDVSLDFEHVVGYAGVMVS
jgi:AmmeMemoRadiSam system protein B